MPTRDAVAGCLGAVLAATMFVAGCDGVVRFTGTTSEAVVGSVLDGDEPVAGVSVSASHRGVRVVASVKSDDRGQFDLGAVVAPHSRIEDYALVFEKDGFEPQRVDLSQTIPAGARVSPCPHAGWRARCRIVNVTMKPRWP